MEWAQAQVRARRPWLRLKLVLNFKFFQPLIPKQRYKISSTDGAARIFAYHLMPLCDPTRLRPFKDVLPTELLHSGLNKKRYFNVRNACKLFGRFVEVHRMSYLSKMPGASVVVLL